MNKFKKKKNQLLNLISKFKLKIKTHKKNQKPIIIKINFKKLKKKLKNYK